MSSDQVLVSVRFQGYYLQLLVAKTSSVIELVQAMRNNAFIPPELTNSRLMYKKANTQQVKGNDRVTVLIQRKEDTVHYLNIEVRPQSSLQDSMMSSSSSNSNSNNSINSSSNSNSNNSGSGPDFFQQQTNKLLQKIIKYLREGTVDTLLKARQNNKLEPTMAEHLTSIGLIFSQQKNQIDFYAAAFKGLTTMIETQSNQNLMDNLFSEYMDHLKAQKMKAVKDLNKAIIQLKKKISDRSQLEQQLRNDISDKNDEIDDLKKDLKKERDRFSQLQNQLSQKKSEINRINSSIDNLNIQIQKEQKTIKSLKQDLTTSKNYGDQLALDLKNQKEKFQTQQKVRNKQIEHLKTQIQTFKRQNSQKERLLIEKDEEIKKAKQNSIEEQLIAYTKGLDGNENKPIFPAIGAPLKGKLEGILIEEQLVKDLKQIITTQMRNQITSIYELLSYDRRIHRNISLKQNFQSLIHKKRSLLFIGRSQGDDGKLFGAFTEEQFDKEPESYFIPDFKGCSFLFSLIQNEFRYFKILEGENSILFDLDNLIFGNDELAIDFENHRCTSKFAEGKNLTYDSNPAVGGKNDDYKLFLSQKPIKGKNSVNLVQYKIYEIQFKDNAKKK